MNSFTFQNKTKVIFGKDTEKEVGKEIIGTGKRVLLHYGGGSIKKSGLYDRVIKSLSENNIEVIELGGVKPNPRLELVNKGIKLCREHDVDYILAVGGGSVIDSAKAIGVGYYYDGDVWDYFEYISSPEKMLPLGVVLTIPAAGSETSGGSVITKEEGKLKKAIVADFMRPEFCILNPELNYTLPQYQTACGISDMLAHVMERYFTQVKSVELTDRLCEGVMKTVINNAYRLIKNPNDYDARAEILWSGTIAHNDLIGTGRDGDWASHGLEHEISAITDIAHGAGLSIIFPAWIKYVYKDNPVKFLQFANRVFDIEINHEDNNETILRGIKALENFYRDLDLPTRLSEVDFDNTHIKTMASKATSNDSHTIGSFKKLSMTDAVNIYNLAK